ncbi:MAG TPA: hypothetical protein VIO16_00660 [Dehalococcoidia bacterium]|jgi:hypothetical protein
MSLPSSYYTSAEVAAKFRRSPRQLKTLRERCGLPHWRPEGQKDYLYPSEQTDAWELLWLTTPPIVERRRRSEAGTVISITPRRRITRVAGSGGLRRKVFTG